MELIIVVDKWCSEGVWDLYGRVEGWWVRRVAIRVRGGR